MGWGRIIPPHRQILDPGVLEETDGERPAWPCSLDMGGGHSGLSAYLPAPSPPRTLQRDRVLESEHTYSSGPWAASPELWFRSVKHRTKWYLEVGGDGHIHRGLL